VLKFSATLGLVELLLFTRVLFLSFAELTGLYIKLPEIQHYSRKATPPPPISVHTALKIFHTNDVINS
jgi:hypothetical protein